MKFPNHLVLDINNYSLIRKNQHWSNYYVLAFKTSTSVTPSAHSCSFSKRKNNVIIKNARMVATGPTNYFLRILRRADFKLSSSLFSSFNMNFLKKEKLYTKLKYSRVPQYDIVSGGVAALFAGFLGFLICEKFGFELLDSGDFYFLFMYLVFFFFFCNLFNKILSKTQQIGGVFSFKWFFLYTHTLVVMLRNRIRSCF